MRLLYEECDAFFDLFVCIIIMQIPKPFEECTLHLMATLGILYKISLENFPTFISQMLKSPNKGTVK